MRFPWYNVSNFLVYYQTSHYLQYLQWDILDWAEHYCNILFTIVSSSLVLYLPIVYLMTWLRNSRLCSLLQKCYSYTQNQHYFSYNISLSVSNLRKRQSPLPWIDRCMLLPWTPHQGPDKRGANNNLWVEALQQSSDQTKPSLYLMSPCNQCFFSNTDLKHLNI